MDRDDLIKIFTPDLEASSELPMAESTVSAGFATLAEDARGMKLDLNRELVKNPASTFYARVSGVSMVDDGVDDGDLLVIDKSVEPTDGALAVCFIDGEFTLKRFSDQGDFALLMPANDKYKPIRVDSSNDFMVWGVVRYLIKKM
ncbi:MAG: translesion error-prone DNA polymerase V autoproteolytic subunit [Rikenellaceae bacterium]